MILVVTERCDPHTDFVEPEFDRLGVSWVRLHMSELPTLMQASYRVDGESRAGTLTIRGKTIDMSQVRGVWYRRTERFFLPGLSATEEAVARALRAHEGTAARALEFRILTAGRTGEVIGAPEGDRPPRQDLDSTGREDESAPRAPSSPL
jgi:hypothetical protein